MSANSALYAAIFSRRSVRQYDAKPLDAAMLAQVAEIASQAKPLVPANVYQAARRDEALSNALFALLGAYGKLINPPHALIPYIVGGEHVQMDLGYRAEQIAVRLTQLGVGTCFIGALKAEAALGPTLGLPAGAQVGAILVYGRPAAGMLGRAVNALIRAGAGAEKRLEVEQIAYEDDFDHPAHPAELILALLDAARRAPSARNVQPWRFLWREETLYLYTVANSPKYLAHGPTYELYDCGICMANVALAMEALGIEGGWQIIERPADAPPCPPTLRPLAKLTIL